MKKKLILYCSEPSPAAFQPQQQEQRQRQAPAAMPTREKRGACAIDEETGIVPINRASQAQSRQGENQQPDQMVPKNLVLENNCLEISTNILGVAKTERGKR